MKFRKISENKIHCIITKEEMVEKGIGIDDFLEHQDKTEAFIREVLAEAKYELNMDDLGYYYSVQMSVMPEGDISLVISGESSAGKSNNPFAEFGKRLQDFKEIMEAAKKELDAKKSQAAAKEAGDQKEAPSTDAQASLHGQTEDILHNPLWIRTSRLDACISMAKKLVNFEGVESSLYKYDEEYFMRFTFSKKEQQIAGAILVVSEYADELFTDEQGGKLLIEHGKAICKENAIEMLRKL